MIKFMNRKILGLIALAVTALNFAAFADGTTQSFNATNTIQSGDSIVRWPTNAVAGVNSGQGVGVQSYGELGFYITGNVGVAGTATVQVVQSPFVGASTYSNYQQTATMTFTIPMAATGPFTWVTNFPSWWVRDANTIGISSITNAAGTLTNADLGIIIKYVPYGLRQ